jgi:hypothetical protein
MTNGPTPLRVETEVFEGPFDLLLHLVRVSEMDIFDIDIATITDQFLAHLVRMERQSIEVGGEFLVMASTLLNIKSRTLLPENPHADDGEEEDEVAIRTTEDLVHQLIEYRRFKEMRWRRCGCSTGASSRPAAAPRTRRMCRHRRSTCCSGRSPGSSRPSESTAAMRSPRTRRASKTL